MRRSNFFDFINYTSVDTSCSVWNFTKILESHLCLGFLFQCFFFHCVCRCSKRDNYVGGSLSLSEWQWCFWKRTVYYKEKLIQMPKWVSCEWKYEIYEMMIVKTYCWMVELKCKCTQCLWSFHFMKMGSQLLGKSNESIYKTMFLFENTTAKCMRVHEISLKWNHLFGLKSGGGFIPVRFTVTKYLTMIISLLWNIMENCICVSHCIIINYSDLLTTTDNCT